MTRFQNRLRAALALTLIVAGSASVKARNDRDVPAIVPAEHGFGPRIGIEKIGRGDEGKAVRLHLRATGHFCPDRRLFGRWSLVLDYRLRSPALTRVDPRMKRSFLVLGERRVMQGRLGNPFDLDRRIALPPEPVDRPDCGAPPCPSH